MKTDKLKIDLRNADKDDMMMLARFLMSVSGILTQNGYKIHLKRSSKTESGRTEAGCTEQKFN